ncbi:MAG: VOC family protein [Xanthobacteraceae bacterium]
MIQCRRLGYATLSTSDLDRQVRYYADILGLFQLRRDDDHAVFATRQGRETLVLVRGERPELSGIAFEIAPSLSLEDAQQTLANAGVEAVLRAGRTPCVDQVLAFKDPKGTEIELFNSPQFAETDLGELGVNPLKLGHIAYFVRDVPRLTAFYEKLLGFRRSDWRGDQAMFLRCNTDHHTINFFQGEEKLGHLAFEVKDFAELVRASDYLVRRDFPLDWGPARHTIGHNCACYHTNPDGIRTELYAEMDQMNDEELGYYEPKPWHEDRPQRPKDWLGQSAPRNKWIPGVP